MCKNYEMQAETPNVTNFENRYSCCSVPIIKGSNFLIHILYDLLHKVFIDVKNLEDLWYYPVNKLMT